MRQGKCGLLFVLWMVIFKMIQVPSLQAQDIHFTQYYNSPLNLNPALTGFSESRFRFGMHHRNQWRSVTSPFITYSAYTDVQVFKRRYQGDIWSIGLVANKDEAGDSHFGTTQINFSLSWIKALGNQNRDILGFGLMTGWVQRSLDYSKLNFDEQYNGTLFNPGLSITESFAIDQFSYVDYATGAHWQHIVNYNISWKLGLAAWHLSRPNQSLMKSDDARLPVKSVGYVEVEATAGTQYKIYPALYFAHQGSYSEFIPGFRVKQEWDQAAMNYTAITYGLMYRHKDAVNVVMGFEYRYMQVQLSYDVNVSGLRDASGYRGGLELSAGFKYSKSKQRRIKEIECPIF